MWFDFILFVFLYFFFSLRLSWVEPTKKSVVWPEIYTGLDIKRYGTQAQTVHVHEIGHKRTMDEATGLNDEMETLGYENDKNVNK